MSDDGSGDDWENLLESGELDQKLNEIKLGEVKQFSTSQSKTSKCVDPFDDCVPGHSEDKSRMNLSDPTYSGPVKILSNDSRQLLRRPEPTMKILKRPEQSSAKVTEAQAPKTAPKSLSQREAEYAEARQRILGSEAEVTNVTTQSGSAAGKSSAGSGNPSGKNSTQSGKQNNKQQGSTSQGGKQGNRGGSNSNRKQTNNSQVPQVSNNMISGHQYFLPGMNGSYGVPGGHYPPPPPGGYSMPPGAGNIPFPPNSGGPPYPPMGGGGQYPLNGGQGHFPGNGGGPYLGINYPPPPRPGQQDGSKPFFQVRR